MRVGMIYPEKALWPKLAWVAAAFASLGHEVQRGTSAADFPRLSQECDVVVLGHKGIGGRWPDLRRHFALRSAVVVQWWFDLVAFAAGRPLAEQSYLSPDNHRPLMQVCDIVFVKERALLEEYRELGINAAYLDQGAPVGICEVVRKPEPQWDVLLWGQAKGYVERIRDAVALKEAGLRVAWASSDPNAPAGIERLPWCHPDELPDLAGRATCVLSSDWRNDVEGYWSDRLWMALGMGCCVLRRETPGLPDGPFLTYSHRGELIDHALRMTDLKNTNETPSPAGVLSVTPLRPPAAVEIGRKARQWTLRHHTLANRCEELLQEVERFRRDGRQDRARLATAPVACA